MAAFTTSPPLRGIPSAFGPSGSGFVWHNLATWNRGSMSPALAGIPSAFSAAGSGFATAVHATFQRYTTASTFFEWLKERGHDENLRVMFGTRGKDFFTAPYMAYHRWNGSPYSEWVSRFWEANEGGLPSTPTVWPTAPGTTVFPTSS